MNLTEYKKIHFIGIGGIGVSGIAKFLLLKGIKISGSDKTLNKYSNELKTMGAEVFEGHAKENIKDVDLVIYSSAIKPGNPELDYALSSNIKSIKRGEALACIVNNLDCYAVAGTHGKTTTSSIMSMVKVKLNNASFIVGGNILNYQTQAKIGSSNDIVIETDESDGSFLLLKPKFTIVTNIDTDHLEHYKTFDKLKDSFLKYVNDNHRLLLAVINKDNEELKSLIPKFNKKIVTYSLKDSDSNYFVKNIESLGLETNFDLYKDGKFIKKIKIPLIGEHNVSNALAVIALMHATGNELTSIENSLNEFKGVSRRLEKIENKYGLKVFDDYGHHPTEVKCAIHALKQTCERLVVIFEPHRYTRTRDCWVDFTKCFDEADKILMLPIYSANEDKIEGVTSEKLVEEIKIKKDIKLIQYTQVLEKILENKNATILILGAGPISNKIREILC